MLKKDRNHCVFHIPTACCSNVNQVKLFENHLVTTLPLSMVANEYVIEVGMKCSIIIWLGFGKLQIAVGLANELQFQATSITLQQVCHSATCDVML